MQKMRIEFVHFKIYILPNISEYYQFTKKISKIQERYTKDK